MSANFVVGVLNYFCCCCKYVLVFFLTRAQSNLLNVVALINWHICLVSHERRSLLLKYTFSRKLLLSPSHIVGLLSFSNRPHFPPLRFLAVKVDHHCHAGTSRPLRGCCHPFPILCTPGSKQ